MARSTFDGLTGAAAGLGGVSAAEVVTAVSGGPSLLDAAGRLVVDITYTRCNDAMSGHGYEHQVTVIVEGRAAGPVHGCGGTRRTDWDRAARTAACAFATTAARAGRPGATRAIGVGDHSRPASRCCRAHRWATVGRQRE